MCHPTPSVAAYGSFFAKLSMELAAGTGPDVLCALVTSPWAHYLDGHFVLCFGKNKLPKGWWPQRRSAFRGHYQHWANDTQGHPIFYLMHQAYTMSPRKW